MWGNRFVPGYQGDRWKCDYWMAGETFDKLVTWLTPRLEKQETFLRQPILVMKRVAIALWRLATGDCFRSIGKTFGVGKSTCVEITHEFCKALVDKASEYIKFPETALEVGEAIQMFKDDVSCKIPQAFAAVDGTLIEIGAPDTPDKADYFARTKRYAVNTQGIIGANLEYFHISTGFPGSCHDARMWSETSMAKKLRDSTVPRRNYFKRTSKTYHSWRWRLYPLYIPDDTIQKPCYKITHQIQSYIIIVLLWRGFGIVKARYRILLKRQETTNTNVSAVIISCFVLHNFRQRQNDQYEDHDGILQELIAKERAAKRKRTRDNTVCLREKFKGHTDAVHPCKLLTFYL